MGRGLDDERTLVSRRGDMSLSLDDFLHNENDRLLFPPEDVYVWMNDGEMTDRALQEGPRANSKHIEGLSPYIAAVVFDTAEIDALDRGAFNLDADETFLSLPEGARDEYIIQAKAAYVAIAKQGMVRPLAEVDEEDLLEDKGYWIVDDVRKIAGDTYDVVSNASDSGRPHPTHRVPSEDIDDSNPYMIMTVDNEWVPFDFEQATEDAHLFLRSQGLGRDVPYSALDEEEKMSLAKTVANTILISKRPMKLLESNEWSYRQSGDGGLVEKLVDPMYRLHNAYGAAIIHRDKDGKVVQERFFEDGREPRDGRPVALYQDGSKEYWSGDFSVPTEDGEDFVINIYRIEYKDGSREWWSSDGLMYRRLTADGSEDFDEGEMESKALFSEVLLLSNRERKRALETLGYFLDEIEIIKGENDPGTIEEKLNTYRKSPEYKKAREERESAKSKIQEKRKGAKELKKIDSLLFQ